MSGTEINRRSLLFAATGISVGIIVPETFNAQTVADHNAPDAKMVGAIHGDMLGRLSDSLKDTSPFSEPNLMKLVDLLSGKQVGDTTLPKVLTPEQSDQIRQLIQAIYSSADVDAVAKKIEEMYRKVSNTTRDLGAAIVSIAHDSVQYAKKHKKAIFIVASDVGGALTGATQASKLGPYAAVVGALAGAITASYLAATKDASPVPTHP